MRRLALRLALLLPAPLTAQTAVPPPHGLFLGLANLGTQPRSAVALLDPAGRLTTFLSTPAGPWPYWGNVWGAVMDAANETVLLHGLAGLANPPGRYVIARFDPARRAVVGTLWSGPWLQGLPRNLTNLTLNGDGLLASYDNLLNRLVVLDPVAGGWQSRRLIFPGLNAGLGGFTWDRLRGDYVYATAQNFGRAHQALFRTALDGRTTTLATTSQAALQAAYGGDLLQDGRWVSSSWSGPRYLEVLPGTRTFRAGPTASGQRFWDVTAAPYAAPGTGYYAAAVTSPQAVLYVDAATVPHTVTTLLSTATALPSWLLEVLPLHDRGLTLRRTGKATWDLHVNPGGGRFAGRAYAVAVSLRGATPPVRLPDGRELFLAPDPLTTLSLRGALAPLLTGNLGTLDAGGRARGRLDLRPLGPALNGLVLHFAGVVLDPAAPWGIAWVFEPWALVVQVRP